MNLRELDVTIAEKIYNRTVNREYWVDDSMSATVEIPIYQEIENRYGIEGIDCPHPNCGYDAAFNPKAVPYFSSSKQDMWLLIEQMGRMGFKFCVNTVIHNGEKTYHCCFSKLLEEPYWEWSDFHDADILFEYEYWHGYGETPELAVCEAALKTKDVEKYI